MNGKPDTHGSKWFAFEVSYSTQEALGVLVALKLKFGTDPHVHRSRITVAPTVSDRPQEVNDLQVPSSAILMEMSAYMKRMGIKA